MEFIPRVQKSVLKSRVPVVVESVQTVKVQPQACPKDMIDVLISKLELLESRIQTLEAFAQRPPISEPVSPEPVCPPTPTIAELTQEQESTQESPQELTQEFTQESVIVSIVEKLTDDEEVPVAEPADEDLESMDRADLLMIASKLGLRAIAKTSKLIAAIRQARQKNIL